MKSIIKSLIAAAALIGLSAHHNQAIGQTTTGPVPSSTLDARAVSRAMLDAPAAYYIGDVSFTGTNGQSITEQFRLDFVQPDQSHGYWAVTSLTINGTNQVHIDTNNPPVGLAVYTAANPLNYNASINGFDVNGVPVRYGSFYTPFLLPTDSINFVLVPYNQKIVVSYVPPSGVNTSNLLISVNGSTGSYDPLQGGFVVYIDPINRGHTYIIYNTVTGQPVGTGTINYGAPAADIQDNLNSISLADEGNVLEVAVNNSANAGQYAYRGLQGLNLDCALVSTNGVSTPAKVIDVTGVLPHDSFSVAAFPLTPGSTISVSTLVNGELVSLSSVTIQSNGWGQVIVRGYDRYSVTIIGNVDPNDGLSGFDMDMNSLPADWNVPPGTSTGGGGKG